MRKILILAALSALGQLAPVAPAMAQESLQAVNTPYRGYMLPVAPYRSAQAAPHIYSGALQASAQRWEVAVSDVTIAKTFERWAQQAGYRLKWDASKNFLVSAPDVYEGDFETAVAKVLSSPGISGSDYPLEVCIYANTPPLMRVTRQGEQVRDCSAYQ